MLQRETGPDRNLEEPQNLSQIYHKRHRPL